jgi:putative Flp pilus-assembly TadE/G-like protein
LSSTTKRAEERGQVLVLFAASLAVLFLIAALAFDVGMVLLERRDQQNAADAAALAGARYVLTSPNFNASCASAGGNAAATAACEVVLANDFDNATANEDVFVHIPPLDGEFAGFPGFVQVQIAATRAPIFAGIMGQTDWSIGSMAVAANQPGVTYTFGMLALNETKCKAILIAGTGTVNAAANVQSNSDGSDCGTPPGYGLSRTGAGVLNVTAPDAVCRSVGAIQDQGSGTMTCTPSEFSFALPDPLEGLAAPARPALAAGMKEMIGTSLVPLPANIPAGCPGDTSVNKPSDTTPHLCTLGQGGSQANRKWILSPGLYHGGLNLKGGVTAYLLPGIYWIGGGGFQTSNDASVISVESETDLTKAVCTPGATPPCVGGGGVLLYNSKLSLSPAGPISLGGGGATLSLQPYQYPFGSTTIDLVIFQDRTVTEPVTLNGSNSQAADVRGIVYVPAASVTVNGSNSVFNMDQVIADSFKINGSGGTVNVLRETGVDVEISAVGLVE